VLPFRTRDALVALVEGQAQAGLLGFLDAELNLDRTRERVGAFVGGTGSEIALLRNTSDGANTIARGFPFEPGDEVIISDNEFPANAHPWLALRESGVVVRTIETARERLTPDVLRTHISKKTRIVSVSWVSFGDGYRHDLAALAEIAHAHGAIFCVDAIQGLGAFPLDVRAMGIDALYAGGAKWLLALPGASFLYVCAELRERLAVKWRGWRDVANIWNFLDYEQELAPDGTRFEGGTVNFIGVAAMEHSMHVLATAGIDRISTHVLALTDRLYAGLQQRDATIASHRGNGISSGIITFTLPGHDPVALGRKLGEAGFCVTYRPTGIRVSPHGYNTEAEIDAFLAELP
jgi:selenocysteine lyase/cysteine desulfurase